MFFFCCLTICTTAYMKFVKKPIDWQTFVPKLAIMNHLKLEHTLCKQNSCKESSWNQFISNPFQSINIFHTWTWLHRLLWTYLVVIDILRKILTSNPHLQPKLIISQFSVEFPKLTLNNTSCSSNSTIQFQDYFIFLSRAKSFAFHLGECSKCPELSTIPLLGFIFLSAAIVSFLFVVPFNSSTIYLLSRNKEKKSRQEN